MKKVHTKIISILMSVVVLIAQSYSLSARTIPVEFMGLEESVFIPDLESVDLAIAELNELDEYLDLNPGVSYAELQAAGSVLIKDIADMVAPFGQSEEGNDEDPLGIPAFWWGCFLGIIGVLLVYIFTDNNKDQTKMAFKGFLVTLVSSLAASVVILIVTLAVTTAAVAE
ncbi:MAG: hypothetical protein GX876_10645 [Bacteroidales bacterium]|nr:hypothetical protein [Bacteroidales bacterium]